ncbi:alpha-protein kinase 1-like [Sitodiplosis mosellana]|uniref:alpha-protein kinase 1-like n=1 Tax=Sitodiplosis mosellana TaxID=263140 RepID=UPI0024440EF7|nr:alpha-protein kinase 1-like [Sitodiplosis mosellana]
MDYYCGYCLSLNPCGCPNSPNLQQQMMGHAQNTQQPNQMNMANQMGNQMNSQINSGFMLSPAAMKSNSVGACGMPSNSGNMQTSMMNSGGVMNNPMQNNPMQNNAMQNQGQAMNQSQGMGNSQQLRGQQIQQQQQQQQWVFNQMNQMKPASTNQMNISQHNQQEQTNQLNLNVQGSLHGHGNRSTSAQSHGIMIGGNMMANANAANVGMAQQFSGNIYMGLDQNIVEHQQNYNASMMMDAGNMNALQQMNQNQQHFGGNNMFGVGGGVFAPQQQGPSQMLNPSIEQTLQQCPIQPQVQIPAMQGTYTVAEQYEVTQKKKKKALQILQKEAIEFRKREQKKKQQGMHNLYTP